MSNSKSKLNMMIIALIPIGIAINFAGSAIANTLKLPMYLDSIGTVLVAALCGILPGMITGAVTSIVSSIAFPPAMAYAIVTACYGLVVALMAKKGFMTTLPKGIIVGLVLAVCGVALATPITAYLFGGITETGQSVIIVALQAMGFGLIPSTIISGFITELLDKLISIFIVFFVIKAISDRFLSKFPLGSIYYKKQVAANDVAADDDED